MSNDRAMISFSFDDFPRSALLVGGALLENHGLSGTYYASLGLVGTSTPTGKMFQKEDLLLAVERRHEIGCHTFGHLDAGATNPSLFEQSIIENQGALDAIVPGMVFKTFSYPIGVPSPGIKRRSGRHFLGCRAGGQSFNVGRIDLNFLNAFFVEQSRDDLGFIKQIIDQNIRSKGWLIFATHDVSDHPTRFGCTPEVFEAILNYSVASGALILPVVSALRAVGAAPADSAAKSSIR